MILSKKIKVFLSLLFLFSVVVTVAIFFDFDFKRSLNVVLPKSKEIIVPSATPTLVEKNLEFVHLSPNTFNLPVEKSYFEAIKEESLKTPYFLSFNLKEGEEVKAIFGGEISYKIIKKGTVEEQPNDYLNVVLESKDETLAANYLIVGEFLLENNEQIEAGKTFAKIGKGIVPFGGRGNFDLTVFMQYEKDKYKPIALEPGIFNQNKDETGN